MLIRIREETPDHLTHFSNFRNTVNTWEARVVKHCNNLTVYTTTTKFN